MYTRFTLILNNIQFFLNGVDRVDFHLSLKVKFMFLVLIGNFLLLFELFLMLIV